MVTLRYSVQRTGDQHVDRNLDLIRAMIEQLVTAVNTVSSGTVGPAGPAGPAGATGSAGAAGSTGAVGAAGAEGPAGASIDTAGMNQGPIPVYVVDSLGRVRSRGDQLGETTIDDLQLQGLNYSEI